MKKYLKINSTKFALSTGIMGAILIFLTTITGIYKHSEAATFFTSSIWSSFGYSVTWTGAFIGIILGFIYGFILMWIPITIYNKLIS